jgi:hypothetical protein
VSFEVSLTVAADTNITAMWSTYYLASGYAQRAEVLGWHMNISM